MTQGHACIECATSGSIICVVKQFRASKTYQKTDTQYKPISYMASTAKKVLYHDDAMTSVTPSVIKKPKASDFTSYRMH